MKKIFFCLVFFILNLQAEKITVFVASSASKAMIEIKDEFLKKNTNDEIEFVFGASGKHYHLLKNGRKFDMFFSADSKYPQQIKNDGIALDNPQIYALGVVALYTLDENLLKNGLDSLSEKKIKRISIANPKVAPYGVAAMEILNNIKIYDKIKDKIILGENISQPVMHVDTAAAEVGIVAYSLVSDVNNPKGRAFLIDKKFYNPLEQSFVITKYAKTNSKKEELAKRFSEFVLCDEGKKIIKKYGFDVR
ncbi:molybdate ABC transporter substrate-binding protein [uncultured Campylobacter sp.]|uniref:molybdate ABC transporter substrate-binding protein n=1 Tax=uncultured Campylobacter sp. TaxID=218934 RepID=UPI002603BE2B|nr:molybdate ABC transporter substrate-binding protein [uncultured Campylobacter sp.]